MVPASLLVFQKTLEREPIFHSVGPGGHGLLGATKSIAVASFTVDMHLGGYIRFFEGNVDLSHADGTVFVVVRNHHEERRAGFR